MFTDCKVVMVSRSGHSHGLKVCSLIQPFPGVGEGGLLTGSSVQSLRDLLGSRGAAGRWLTSSFLTTPSSHPL